MGTSRNMCLSLTHSIVPPRKDTVGKLAILSCLCFEKSVCSNKCLDFFHIPKTDVRVVTVQGEKNTQTQKTNTPNPKNKEKTQKQKKQNPEKKQTQKQEVNK